MEEQLKSILSKIFGVAKEDVTDETSPENVAEWDSFNGLLLVTELEKGFNVSFSIEEVVAVKNVGDIKAALRAHGVKI
ncbi:acyl carrier protein [bacterium]|nr:acyl carrier protein [bacterium]MCI0565767.1 acyl carrier protein [bacterium]